MGGYRIECEGWEDLDLLQRLARVGRVLVLPCALYTVRFRPGSAHAGMPVQRFLRVAVAKDRAIRRRFSGSGAGHPRRDPTLDAVYEHSAARLWAGRRLDLPVNVVARGVTGHRARRARLLAWAAWGRVSPGSLRRALRLATSIRDLAAHRHVPDGQPVEWRFG